jgi:hypothetical protein
MLIVTSVLLTILVSYFGVFLAYSRTEPLFTNVIAISYGVGDLVLIISTIALLILAWEFRGGTLSQIWLSLFFSFLLTLISDILFAIATSAYSLTGSFNRSLTDCIWILSYLLFSYALFSFGISIQEAKNRLKGMKKLQ